MMWCFACNIFCEHVVDTSSAYDGMVSEAEVVVMPEETYACRRRGLRCCGNSRRLQQFFVLAFCRQIRRPLPCLLPQLSECTICLNRALLAHPGLHPSSGGSREHVTLADTRKVDAMVYCSKAIDVPRVGVKIWRAHTGKTKGNSTPSTCL